MYGRKHGVKDAHQLFDELLEPDAICWTSVISAFTRNDMFKEALEFFYVMHRDHRLRPDGFTFGTVLTACGNLGSLGKGKQMHAKVITSELYGKVVFQSSLVEMYGKCGSLCKSRMVFDGMNKENSVSSSTVLGVCCQNREFETVIIIVREMKEADVYNFGTILSACSGLVTVRREKGSLLVNR